MFPQHLVDGISKFFPQFDPASLSKLAGDMSSRQYFRFTSGPTSYVAMLMPLDKPVNEEAGASVTATELPFVNVARTLREKQVRVPHVYGHAPELGVLLLEDLGDELMFHAVKQASRETLESYYVAALDQLERLAFTPATSLPECLGHTRIFDEALFHWEFMHFVEYALDKRLKHPIAPHQREDLVSAFRKLSKHLASLPRVFSHRDYHSRNLLVLSSTPAIQLGVIDFQDALQAPLFYDLASLLRDSYVDLPQDLREGLVLRYRDQVAEHEPQLALSPDEFLWQFDLVGTHRNLKAAGRFFFADEVKGLPQYLPDVPRTLSHVKRTLQTYEELTDLWKLLGSSLDELIEATSA